MHNRDFRIVRKEVSLNAPFSIEGKNPLADLFVCHYFGIWLERNYRILERRR